MSQSTPSPSLNYSLLSTSKDSFTRHDPCSSQYPLTRVSTRLPHPYSLSRMLDQIETSFVSRDSSIVLKTLHVGIVDFRVENVTCCLRSSRTQGVLPSFSRDGKSVSRVYGLYIIYPKGMSIEVFTLTLLRVPTFHE